MPCQKEMYYQATNDMRNLKLLNEISQSEGPICCMIPIIGQGKKDKTMATVRTPEVSRS